MQQVLTSLRASNQEGTIGKAFPNQTWPFRCHFSGTAERVLHLEPSLDPSDDNERHYGVVSIETVSMERFATV